MKKYHASIMFALAALILLSPYGHGTTREQSQSMQDALAALRKTKNERSRVSILREISGLIPESSEQLQEIHREIARLESTITPANQSEYIRLGKALSGIYTRSTGPQFSGAIARLLDQEYAALPAHFSGPYGATTRLERARAELRMNQLVTLAEVVGQTKNRDALPVLRKMINRQGLASDIAAKALGRIGDPADLERMISGLKKNPHERLDLGYFGPPAVDRIMRDIDDPTTSATVADSLASNLRYMATHDTLGKFRQLLKHNNKAVREMAAIAICSSTEPGDEEDVIAVAKDTTNMYQLQAFTAMARHWDAKYIPVLRELLHQDREPIVRAESARLLGKFQAREARTDLEQSLSDPAGEVQRASKAALDRLE